MNKKILSIFALIMAISILGVSCADNNTTKPEDQKPATLTAEEQKAILKAIGTLNIPKVGSGNVTFTFDENKTVTASSSTYTVEEVAVSADPGASAKANYVDIIPVIQAKDFSSVKTVTINKDAATYQKDTSDAKKVKVIIPFTKGETKGTIVLQLSGAHNSNNLTFVAKEVTADDVQNAVKAAFADMKVGTTGALPNSTSMTVTYTSGTADIAKGSAAITDSSKATVLQVLNDANATTAGSYKKLQSELDKIGLILEDITDFVDSGSAAQGKGSVKFADASAASTATIGKDAATPAALTLTAKEDYSKATAVTDLKVVITINQDAWGK